MITLGVDPGTATTGYGVVDQSTAKIKFLAAGVIRTPKEDKLEARLLAIYDDITELVAEYKPQTIAVELLYFAKNVTTAISVAQARGVVLLAAAQAKLPVVEYTPLQVKQALTGYGRADKPQMQLMVQKLLGLKELPKPDDAADALAVAICHTAIRL